MAKPKPTTKRSTRAEFDRRVHEVLRLRLGGAEFTDLREYALAPEQNWNVSDGQLWRYIKAADVLCQKHFDGKANHLFPRHLLQRRLLYAHALNAGDYRTALAVLKDEAQLEGLYPPPKAAPLDGFPGAEALATMKGLVEMLARTIAAVGRGECDGKAAGTIGSLTVPLMHAIEKGELEQRLATLEEQLASQQNRKQR